MEGVQPIRSGLEFMQAWAVMGTEHQTHHIIRLPAGCVKWFQAGCRVAGLEKWK